MKIPKTLGACADQLFTLRQERLTLQKSVEALEEQEKELKEHIIQTLPKSEASGVAGRLARVTVVTKQVPQVKDWNVFYQYVKKTGQFDLMQRRLSDGAIKERWEAGTKIPGVEAFAALSISLNKV